MYTMHCVLNLHYNALHKERGWTFLNILSKSDNKKVQADNNKQSKCFCDLKIKLSVADYPDQSTRRQSAPKLLAVNRHYAKKESVSFRHCLHTSWIFSISLRGAGRKVNIGIGQ